MPLVGWAVLVMSSISVDSPTATISQQTPPYQVFNIAILPLVTDSYPRVNPKVCPPVYPNR
jgi:hypothetical protein